MRKKIKLSNNYRDLVNQPTCLPCYRPKMDKRADTISSSGSRHKKGGKWDWLGFWVFFKISFRFEILRPNSIGKKLIEKPLEKPTEIQFWFCDMSKLPIFGLFLSVGNLSWVFSRVFSLFFSRFFFYWIRPLLAQWEEGNTVIIGYYDKSVIVTSCNSPPTVL